MASFPIKCNAIGCQHRPILVVKIHRRTEPLLAPQGAWVCRVHALEMIEHFLDDVLEITDDTYGISVLLP